MPVRLPLGIARGLNYEIDWENEKRLYLGLYECELNRHLRRLVPRGQPCFDVGGFHGYDALVLAKLSQSEVVSFEPEGHRCQRIEANARANPELRIKVVRGCVGNGKGKLSLDDYGLHPGFVKIDVDGAEAEVLQGAKRIIEQGVPMIVEVHSQALEESCREMFSGYDVRTVDQRKWLKDYRPIAHNRWLVARPAEAEPTDRP